MPSGTHETSLHKQEKITNTVQDELKMISSIEEFIEEDKTEPAGKEGAQ